MKRALDLVFVIIGAAWPVLGVVWLSWDIYEVVFLYTVEVSCILVYHSALYWRTARALPTSIKRYYIGSASLRIFIELILVLGAFTLLVDATVGQRTTVFEHWPVLLNYIWVTVIPLGSILAHYFPKLWQIFWPRSTTNAATSLTLRHLTPLWLWVLRLPLPAFLYSYALVNQSRGALIIILLGVMICKLIAELMEFFDKDQAKITLVQSDSTKLTSSVFSSAALISQFWSYSIILVGFFAVNPFTHDPRFSLTTNALIYLGCIIAAAPLVYRRRQVVQFDVTAKRIVITSGWVWRRQRTITLADIVNVRVKRNEDNVPYHYTFIINHQPPWRCSPAQFIFEEWQAWWRTIQVHCPNVSIPSISKK